MTNIILKESKRVISDCFAFEKDSSIIFNIEYIDFKVIGETYTDKSGNTRNKLEKVFRHLFVNKENLTPDLQKKSKSEICQELKGKSLLITTCISD